MSELVKTSACSKISVSLWLDNHGDHFLEKIYQLGIWNGISIAVPFDDYVDIFSFASYKNNEKINNFYINHLEIINRFIIFFRLKAKKIIEHADKNMKNKLDDKIQFYNSSDKNEKIDAINNLRKYISSRKTSIKSNHFQKINLTNKETTYLTLLLEGKSMNVIAKELNISKRTIESCLENIKSKTGYSTKIELLSVFSENKFY